MGLFKKRAKGEGPTTEWEETLVAQDEPPTEPDLLGDEGATLTEEPVPGESGAEPSMMPRADGEIPYDVQEHVRSTGGKTVLLEKNFDRPTKRRMEGEVTASPRISLNERTWNPAHPIDLKAIRRSVDRLSPYQAKAAGKWLAATFKTASKKPKADIVPGNIIGKRIVYETEGGFVVEVTYRSGAETLKSYFTLDSTGGRERALESLQSGRAALAHAQLNEAIDSLRRPSKGASLPVPPGKVNTYPIHNDVDIIEIEGIGDAYARRMHELGIHTTDQLRLMNATVIANNIGAAPTSVEAWQQMAELMLVPGIGKQYAEALVRAGVGAIDALKRAKPKALAQAVNAAIKAGRLTSAGVRTPRVQGWIRSARKMKKQLQPFPAVVR